MALTIKLNVPPDLEEKLRAETRNLDADVTEVYLLELFRRGKISHYELSQALGLDRFETDAYLKHHKVFEGSLTMEDLEADHRTLKELMSKGR